MFSQKGTKDFKEREKKKTEDEPKNVAPSGSTEETSKLIAVMLYCEIWNGTGSMTSHQIATLNGNVFVYQASRLQTRSS